MIAVARQVRVLLDGEYVAREVASAVLSPVVLIMAFCAAASADHKSTLLGINTIASMRRSHESMLPLVNSITGPR